MLDNKINFNNILITYVAFIEISCAYIESYEILKKISALILKSLFSFLNDSIGFYMISFMFIFLHTLLAMALELLT